MNRAQLQAFSAAQLQFFAGDAAMCVRRDQLHFLSEAQRYAMWEAGSEVRDTHTNTLFACSSQINRSNEWS